LKSSDECFYSSEMQRDVMRRSTKSHILTTHVGSLPAESRFYESDPEMRDAITSAVAAQREVGLDVINDGEHTKNGDWLRYIETRLTGFEPQEDSSTIFTQGATAKSSPTTMQMCRLARPARPRSAALVVGEIGCACLPSRTAAAKNWLKSSSYSRACSSLVRRHS
jgi:hypothetical protein